MSAAPPGERSMEEWAQLNNGARRKARQRERDHLRGFFGERAWSMRDVGRVLSELTEDEDGEGPSLLEALFDSSPEVQDIYVEKVRVLMKRVEADDWLGRAVWVAHALGVRHDV